MSHKFSVQMVSLGSCHAGCRAESSQYLAPALSRVTGQVELDCAKVSRIRDEAGLISREDFMQFARDTHLLDFECSAMGEAILLLSPRRTRKQPAPSPR